MSLPSPLVGSSYCFKLKLQEDRAKQLLEKRCLINVDIIGPLDSFYLEQPFFVV